MPDHQIEEAIILMNAFARRTGLSSNRTPQRYLWTDAFAVCNYLGLAGATGEQEYLALAVRLADQVHHVLGRYREDDPRQGWISGLSDAEGEAHPVIGGLRIGKPLPERAVDEPFDERLEWERDGQYFHYLTKWMHALDQLGRATGDFRYAGWACELAVTAHKAFSRHPGMVWKMSTDLKRILVPSMGQHDPLDGYLTALQLQATASDFGRMGDHKNLEAAIRDYRQMTDKTDLVTADPLGIGGLLVDAWRVVQLMVRGVNVDSRLLERLLVAAHQGLTFYAVEGELTAPAEFRLAFRELGLAIGLLGIKQLEQIDTVIVPENRLKPLTRFISLSEQIISFWRDPMHQRVASWRDHRDINEVMLATSLLPAGFLGTMQSS